jgi:peptide/nickel transport system substrate-binding protein
MQIPRYIATPACVLLLSCIGFAVSAEPTQLRARLLSDIRSTDPGVNRDGTTDSVVMHMVEGLVALAEDTSIAPMLAASYDVAKDGVTYTFRLRKGIQFHNGALLTSGDVVWALKRYFDPATKWCCQTLRQ